ncbi:hypothetical protein [Rhodohalobacter sulfatireducens]|uniref:Transporter n=1 Tax=Rhodohalobacter sulfatireducens TaxID=2911366 RepID=A0ABS9KEJ6_9BACT|nr:hypothetical protein [Rhodohalobacter sulfatireducens]MCG2589251.1 hypothetical protein [Rhodohalobacter sulfatireducens]
MSDTTKILLTAIIAIFLWVGDGILMRTLSAQTCSCAGAPLVGAQSLGSIEQGNLVLGFTTHFNNIDKLYAGSDELKNRSADRSTFTNLLEANYGITNRLSFTGTFSYVTKERVTGLQNSTTSQTLQTAGVGDALVMLKYNLIKQTLWKPYQFIVGAGSKIPIGSFSETLNGIQLNADMQPGTGSWDYTGWTFLSYTFRAQNITLFTVNAFSKTTSAQRFNKNDNFEFGNELNSLLGATGPLFNRFSFNLRLKYRTAGSDLRNGVNLPSTGGEWLNFEPGIGTQLTDRLSMQVSGEIPIYRNVNGTQPSTTYILSASLFFSLNKNEGGFNLGLPGR